MMNCNTGNNKTKSTNRDELKNLSAGEVRVVLENLKPNQILRVELPKGEEHAK